MRSRFPGAVSLAVVLLLLAGCGDDGPTVPHGSAEVVPLELSANLSGTPIQTLAVEVTAADIVTPLAFNLVVSAGNASGSIEVPPGTARTITVRAFDSEGEVTHEGSVTVDVARGNNPPVHIPLLPRSGHQPIDVTLAEVGVTVTPGAHSLLPGESVQLAAQVIASGTTVNVDVVWATLSPAVATVTADGLVTGVMEGSAVIVATYAGVGAAATIDVGSGVATTWYADVDGDGYGDPATSQLAVLQPDGYVADGTDCDDASAGTHPDADEIADGADNDCDGEIDESLMTLYYLDADGDGWGGPQSILVSVPPSGYVDLEGDCDDSDAGTYPGAPETADGHDNDCDGTIDEGLETVWFRDADGDAYGDPDNSILAVLQPEGYVELPIDCDDSDASIHPGATEIPGDGIDQDCDDLIE